jgi:hypothetical protein
MSIDQISRRYIELAFDIEQHVEGFVDAYFGPPELRQRPPARPPAAIAAAIAALRAEVAASDYPDARRRYLDVQLRGMGATAGRLAGDELSYADEVRACFDIEPTYTPEAVFETANAELEELAPGAGPLAERMGAWRDRFNVPNETARRMIDVIAAEARRRTADLIGLPEGEAVEFSLVSDKPWPATTGTWARPARSSRSTPTCRSAPAACSTWSATRPTPATTPSTRSRRPGSTASAAGASRPSS